MSSTAAIPMELQQISFKPPRRAFVLHNARRHPIDVLYVGNLMTLPARHEVHATKSEVDEDGTPIPGTFVIEDIYTYVPALGDEICTFDSARAVTHILGLQRRPDGTLSDANGAFARSGISFMPRRPSKAVWQKIAEEGDRRVFLKDVENARVTVNDVNKRNNDLRAAGLPPVVVDPGEWQRAIFLLEQYAELTKRTFEPSEGIKPFEEAKVKDELELEAFCEAEALKMAKEAAQGKDIDELALAKSLLAKPRVRQLLQKDFVIRKKGHMPLSDQVLEKAAKSGQSTKEAGLESESPVEALGVPAVEPAPTPDQEE